MVALATTAAATASSPALAAVYYVDRSHSSTSDTNPGTETLPWRTIQHAADTLVAGDTVWIKAGTYAEEVTIDSVGAQSQEIVFAAYPGHVVTVDGSSVTLPPWRGLVMIQSARWVRLRGIRVANAGPEVTNTGIQVEDSIQVVIEQNHTVATASSGILVWNSSDILVANNEVEQAMTTGANSRNECITVGRTTRFEVRGNHVHDTNPARGEGICLKDGSSYGTAHHNHVHDVPRVGIYVDAWTEHTHHIDVFANRVHDVAGDDLAAGSGIAVASEQGGLLGQVRFYNNVSYHNRLLGLEISDCCIASHPLVDVQVVNNSFWGNGWADWGGGIGNENDQTTGLVVHNNAVAGNLSFEIAFEGIDPTGATLENNLIGGWHGYPGELCGTACRIGDPIWVNPAAGDFHLQAGSPAIDAGATQGAPTVDFDDRLRDAQPDIGAFEWSPLAGVAVSVSDCAVVEPDQGLGSCVFKASLTASSGQTIIVSFATADGTAVVGTDYTAASGTLTFSPGTTSQSIPVSVNGNASAQPNRIFVLNLSGAVNAILGRSQAKGTITDNDLIELYTLAPCRLADTRGSGGPALAANTTRSFAVAGSCSVPMTAKTVVLNVTVVGETELGNLRLYPSDAIPPGSSTINFSTNKVRANNAIIALGTDGKVAVQCAMAPGSSGSTHLVLDVFGYFE